MTWEMFMRYLHDSGVDLYDLSDIAPPQQIVIRTEQGDCDVAAVHRSRDGTTLIIDLGHPIMEGVTHG